jgi:hypothetical protein
MRSHRHALTFIFPIIATLAVAPCFAGLDIDLGSKVKLGDDVDVYLGISSHYFGHDRVTVNRYAALYRQPEDLAVALFLSKRSGRSPDQIRTLHQRGLSWFEISLQLGLPVDIWFIEIDRDPGPPYGKAYGHWKKHRKNKHHRFVLSDVEVRNLVSVRMVHEYYGVPVATAMTWSASGRGLTSIVSDEYHRRHGKSAAKPVKSPPGRKSKSASKGKRKGKKP